MGELAWRLSLRNKNIVLNQDTLVANNKTISLNEIELICIRDHVDFGGLAAIGSVSVASTLSCLYFIFNTTMPLPWLLLLLTSLTVGAFALKLIWIAKHSNASIWLVTRWWLHRIGSFADDPSNINQLAETLVQAILEKRKRDRSSSLGGAANYNDQHILVGSSYQLSDRFLIVGANKYSVGAFGDVTRKSHIPFTQLLIWVFGLIISFMYVAFMFILNWIGGAANSGVSSDSAIVVFIGFILVGGLFYCALQTFLPVIYSVICGTDAGKIVVYKTQDRTQAFELVRQLQARIDNK